MADRAIAAPLRAALGALAAWLSAERVPCAVIGGIAVSLLSRPRTTRDIDVLAFPDESRLDTFLQSGAAHAIVPRIADVLEFATRSRVLLLRHEATGVPVDLVLGSLRFERDVVDRALPTPLGGFDLPVASAADLVVLKAIAHRPSDAADIAALLTTFPDLDVKAIRRTVEEFARLLASSEILEEFDLVVLRLRRGKK